MFLEVAKQIVEKSEKLVNPIYKDCYFIEFRPVENGLEELNIEGFEKLPLKPFYMQKTADNMFIPYTFTDEDYELMTWEIVV
jgi:hypothetical protein